MSYQVLARKWRPRNFAEMVGQEHVVRALSNALEHDRLHHAYLFTGTRGVGKTSLARILAKSLNCETGVTANPCGVCSACREIDEGRFVDLLEVDAASKTGVDDTRELLENVPYAPVRGRYKVYLIDEVHMFSGHSFNALLKTLEEPPPHVKFLLATTDPQKVPVTVLSRCLQFNLKRLPLEQIEAQFRHVLDAEGIEAEAEALSLLARAADGSMRDGLSLLDQAVSFGGGRVSSVEVRTMLGAVATERLPLMLEAVQDADAAGLMAEIAAVAEQAPDFAGLLRELLLVLHRAAVLQLVPDAAQSGWGDLAALRRLAQRVPAEALQLYYQIALTGQRDLPLAPDERSGFEMVMLRMLAFRPDTGAADGDGAASRPRAAAEPPARPAAGGAAAASAPPRDALADRVAEDPPAAHAGSLPAAEVESPADWHRFLPRLQLSGMAAQLASHVAVSAWDGSVLALDVDPACSGLIGTRAEQRLQDALSAAVGRPVTLRLHVRPPADETPARRAAREQQARLQRTAAQVAADPLVRAAQDAFDAELVPGSIRITDQH
jgi:DNA polymerase-3 subunit gamma/tau